MSSKNSWTRTRRCSVAFEPTERAQPFGYSAEHFYGCGRTGGSGFRVAIGGFPVRSSERFHRFQFFLGERLVDGGEIFGHESFKFRLHVAKFLLQRIDPHE